MQPFWDKWLPARFTHSSTICGVEAIFEDGGARYQLVTAQLKKKKIDIKSNNSGSDVKEISATLGNTKMPLVIVVNGRGVTTKKISLSGQLPGEIDNIIRQTLPALRPEDFYIQLYPQQNGTAFISFCRRSLIDGLLIDIARHKLDIAGVYIGTATAGSLATILPSNVKIPTSTHTVSLQNHMLESISPDEGTGQQTVSFGDLIVTSRHILAFAGAFAYLVQHPAPIHSSENISRLSVLHSERNKFRFLMIVSVAFIFLIASANLFIYATMFDKQSALDAELNIYQEKYERISQLLDDYQRNKDVIEKAGVLRRNRLSEFSDKIAQTVPADLTLSELYFNPQKTAETESDSLTSFHSDEVLIKGHCAKSFSVNEWIRTLKTQNFVKAALLKRFLYGSESLQPNFELIIKTE